MKRAGFLLDVGRCVGCCACVLACRLENGWSSEAPWRRVLPLNLRRHPSGPTYFLSVACHHCNEPACLQACPSGAFEKRPDGVVIHHEDRCLGCRYCEMACPFGAPRYRSAEGTVAKCHLCRDRLDRNLRPACVVACPTGALMFLPDAGETGAREQVAGFVDPAGCKPQIRFRPARGGRRAALQAAIEDALARSRRR